MIRHIALALVALALPACTGQTESVANRYERTSGEIENLARALEAETENQVRTVEADIQNQIDAMAANQTNAAMPATSRTNTADSERARR